MSELPTSSHRGSFLCSHTICPPQTQPNLYQELFQVWETQQQDSTLGPHGICILEKEVAFKQDTHTPLDRDMQTNRFLSSDKFQWKMIMLPIHKVSLMQQEWLGCNEPSCLPSRRTEWPTVGSVCPASPHLHLTGDGYREGILPSVTTAHCKQWATDFAQFLELATNISCLSVSLG